MMSETFEKKAKSLYQEHGYMQLLRFEDVRELAREADAALAAKDARFRKLYFDTSAQVDRLSDLNTAKGDLINLFETHFDTLNLWHRYQDDFKAVRARIRSLENE
jgi:hypothetical protein